MSQPSLKQWEEDRKRLRVVYDHSKAKPVEKKNKIKKSRQAAFMSALLAKRTKSSEQLQYTMTYTSDSPLGKEQCGAQAKRDEASSHGRKETQSNMIQIFINTPMNPKCLCLRLNHNTTICNLKQIIHCKLGIRASLQTLHTSNQGFKLCDALTLLDLGIEPETNINLTLTEGLLGGAPTLDETLLRTLAGKLGTDWQQLATNLQFTSAEVGKFVSLAEDNPEEQAFQMLVSWRTKQHDDGGAEEWLRSELVQTGRRDLAAIIPGYERPRAGKKDEVHSRQSSEHQSISDASGIDEKMLRDLAENIGKDWKKLATSLGFKAAQIEALEINDRSDLEAQAFQMFLAWSRRQSNHAEIEDGLKEALEKLGRADMVQIIADVPVSIEACETENELQEFLDSGQRIRIPNVTTSSTEPMTATEAECDDPVIEHQRHLLAEAKKQKLDKAASSTKCLNDILCKSKLMPICQSDDSDEDVMYSRKTVDVQNRSKLGKKRKLDKAASSTNYLNDILCKSKLMPVCQSDDSDEDVMYSRKTVDVQNRSKLGKKKKKKVLHLGPSDIEEEPVNCQRCKVYVTELKDIKQENKKLRKLNINLQSRVVQIEKLQGGHSCPSPYQSARHQLPVLQTKQLPTVSSAITPASSATGSSLQESNSTANKYCIEPIELNIMDRKKKPSLFTKNLLVKFVGSDKLRKSSLDGKTPHRGTNVARQALDTGAVNAIKELVCQRYGRIEVTKVNRYITEKIADSRKSLREDLHENEK